MIKFDAKISCRAEMRQKCQNFQGVCILGNMMRMRRRLANKKFDGKEDCKNFLLMLLLI